MSPGEIHLAYFPFGGRIGTKLRPVLLLTGALGTVPEVLVAYMTSVLSAPLLTTDILLGSSVTRTRIHELEKGDPAQTAQAGNDS